MFRFLELVKLYFVSYTKLLNLSHFWLILTKMFMIFIRELRLGLYHLSNDTKTIVIGSKLKKILGDTI